MQHDPEPLYPKALEMPHLTMPVNEGDHMYRPDLLLLGLDGPGRNGLEVCQQVRARSSVPIIVLSSNGRECDKVRALDLGADDYVCTLFGVQELLARGRSRVQGLLEPGIQAFSLSLSARLCTFPTQ